MECAVRINKVDVINFAMKLLCQFENTTGKDFLFTGLASSLDGDHVPMAGIEHHSKIIMVDLFNNSQDIGRLVEGKTRFKFPRHTYTGVSGF